MSDQRELKGMRGSCCSIPYNLATGEIVLGTLYSDQIQVATWNDDLRHLVGEEYWEAVEANVFCRIGHREHDSKDMACEFGCIAIEGKWFGTWTHVGESNAWFFFPPNGPPPDASLLGPNEVYRVPPAKAIFVAAV